MCAAWPHQADAKPHLPAELPRTLRDSLPSTLLCFTVCPVTKTTNTNKHALTTAALNIWCYEQTSFAKMAGLAVLCEFMPATGSSQTPRNTFTVTDFTQTWSLARIQIVLLAHYNEQ